MIASLRMWPARSRKSSQRAARPAFPRRSRRQPRADPYGQEQHQPACRSGLDPSGNGQTSVRAAFGVFYGAVSGQAVDSSTNGQPFSIRQQFNNVRSLTDPYGNLPGGSRPSLIFTIRPTRASRCRPR